MNFKRIEQNIHTNPFRHWLNQLLFDLQSPLGRNANLFTMLVIICSVFLSMISTIDSTPSQIKAYIRIIEMGVTVFFFAEYAGRIYAGRGPIFLASTAL